MSFLPETLGANVAPVRATSPARASNPLFEGADPDVLVAKGRVWIYATTQVRPSEPVFHAYSSADLVSWTKHDPVLDLRNIPWVPEDGRRHHCAWAPGIFQHSGKIYMFFSVGPQHAKPSRIGVAVADHPAGPFVDSGRPLVTGGQGFEAIDAMVFPDPVSGITYLLCGGSAGAKLRMFELEHDLMQIRRELPVETPRFFTEAAFMHYRAGTYYLSYSHGFFGDATYSVRYSTGPSPFGPWTYRGQVMCSDEVHWGPGHHCFFDHPITGENFIFYHRWNGAALSGKRPKHRSVCMDKVVYDSMGMLHLVKMTGHPARA